MELVRIKKKCEQIWIENLTAANCEEMLLMADKFGLANLRRKSLICVCEHFETSSATQLKELSFKYFLELMESDRIHAHEDLIFQRLVDWVEFDEEDRKRYVPELFNLINLGKITKAVRPRLDVHLNA